MHDILSNHYEVMKPTLIERSRQRCGMGAGGSDHALALDNLRSHLRKSLNTYVECIIYELADTAIHKPMKKQSTYAETEE